MHILILGAGGIGGYFGGRLASSGADIRFLVRPSRAEVLARDGLVVRSPLGDLHTPVTTLTAATAPVDAVLLACKAYDLTEAMEAVAPAIGPSTVILPLLNGVRQLDMLDTRFGRKHVLGGLCHIGVTVNPAGQILHLNTLQRLVFGARSADQADAAERLFEAIQPGGFDLVLSPAIVQDMWEKFTFLATYAGMTTLMRAPIGAIMAADDGEAIMREMLDECLATATAGGYPPRPDAMAQMTSSLTERGSAGTASMFRDMARNGRTEHEHVIGDMLARARKAGVPAPLLRLSLANMQAYEAQRSGTAAG